MNTGAFTLQSERVVTPFGIRSASVVVRDGRIAGVFAKGSAETPSPMVDVGDRVIMPGLVDTHVHINEPGRTEWEGFATATQAAAAGGITTIVDMPLNSSPVTIDKDSLEAKRLAARGQMWVDCGFYGGLIPGNAPFIGDMIDNGILGVKAFLVHSGIDEFPCVTEDDIRDAMPVIARSGLPLLVHCELASPVASGSHSSGRSYNAYLASRPQRWESDAIELMVRLCAEFRCRTHIVHLSSADEIPALRRARSSGLPLTVETCPHYLTFAAEDIRDGDTRMKCAPPIRGREHREGLWSGLKDGTIDFVVSDHSPSPPELKLPDDGDFTRAWGGIASLQLGLPIVWTEARRRGFSLLDVTRWMCAHPATFVGLQERKGLLAPGRDADLVVWDPDASFTVEPSMLRHKHKVTPYEGRELRGTVEMTFVRGNKVYDRGSFIGQPLGAFLGHSKRPAVHVR